MLVVIDDRLRIGTVGGCKGLVPLAEDEAMRIGSRMLGKKTGCIRARSKLHKNET